MLLTDLETISEKDSKLCDNEVVRIRCIHSIVDFSLF